MTTTVEALKAIYLSLGGELTDTYDDIAGGIAVGDYVTIPDVSNAIAQRAASAGIELPSVTSSDNGKVLSVVSGKWNKADAPSMNAFDIFWNSTGTQVGTVSGEISSEGTILSIPLKGQMDYTKTFKGIVTISVQEVGHSYLAKYLLYKAAGTSVPRVSSLYIFGDAIGQTSFALTGGTSPGNPATALKVTLRASSSMEATVTLYSV